jgi:hypothetical protein
MDEARCDACGGFGIVNDWGGGHNAERSTCDKCQGTGRQLGQSEIVELAIKSAQHSISRAVAGRWSSTPPAVCVIDADTLATLITAARSGLARPVELPNN